MSVGSAGCWLGATTVTLADAVFPVPPSVEVTALVTLFCTPLAIPTTLTEKLHEALAESVAPDNVTVAAPALAEIVPPPQVPLKPFGLATTNPAGSESLNATELNELLALGFAKVNVSDVAAFKAMFAAPKAFVIVGGTMVGGGGGLTEEPPPQPAAAQTPRHITIQHEMQQSFVDTLPSLSESRPVAVHSRLMRRPFFKVKRICSIYLLHARTQSD
jgi:hypothetical protein